MSEQNKQISGRIVVIIVGIALALVIIWAVTKQGPVEQSPVTPEQPKSTTTDQPSITKADVPPKINLKDVIKKARGWGPIYKSWYGQQAPDFTLTDITGKGHKLSNYRGKNVMIIFWATWCGPCVMESSHLIALREIVSKGELAMLAISYITPRPLETPEKVKNFVEKHKLNYTVFSANVNSMPMPFNSITYLPSSFFIDKQGKIKIATTGIMSLRDIKAILEAE